jgi:hypothetical protein
MPPSEEQRRNPDKEKRKDKSPDIEAQTTL